MLKVRIFTPHTLVATRGLSDWAGEGRALTAILYFVGVVNMPLYWMAFTFCA